MARRLLGVSLGTTIMKTNSNLPLALPRQDRFSRLAQAAARLAGRPGAFIAACLVIFFWVVSGPLFNYSDSWQLVINTSTTIVTFLMVFLIQNTQNRDQLALQVKLAELIVQMPGAPNILADAEDMSETQLDKLHEYYKARAREKMKTARRRKSRRS
jgi:low affinity Fe/Cu permease